MSVNGRRLNAFKIETSHGERILDRYEAEVSLYRAHRAVRTRFPFDDGAFAAFVYGIQNAELLKGFDHGPCVLTQKKPITCLFTSLVVRRNAYLELRVTR